MKFFYSIGMLLCATTATGFSTTPFILSSSSNVESSIISSSTSLNLFGGSKEGADKDKPGMMDQLKMLKKAQEVASKKMALDKELAKIDHVGTAADGKVSVTIKYVPGLPMQQPSYDAAGIDIDEEYLKEVSSADLSESVAEAIQAGYKLATIATAERMTELTEEMGKIMQDVAPPAAA